MYLWFAASLFVSAALLFCVQPMVGKAVLPLLGGAPAVWNTCMVFFQAMLLGGYLYAHASSTRLGIRKQTVLHLLLLLAPLPVLGALTLPQQIGEGALSTSILPAWLRVPPTEENPTFWLAALLLAMVGLPFFVLSTTAPLLQKWFAATPHRAAGDPYFLYAASNLGSMLALVSYPVLLEPTLSLAEQARWWGWGYLVLVVLVVGCAVLVWRTPRAQATAVAAATTPAPTWARRLHWLALAFVPSSLMLGVTTYITTNIAAIPLLWVLPLALYLLTFIIAFSPRPLLSPALAGRLLPMVLVLVVIALLYGAQQSAWYPIPIHLLGFYLVAQYCHGRLAADRPAADHLTEFYLWLSVGGVLGGLVNGLVAPVLFQQVGTPEYPLVLVLACLLLPWGAGKPANAWQRGLDIGLPLLVAGALAGFFLIDRALNLKPTQAGVLVVLFALGGVCYTFAARPPRFGLALGLLVLTFFIVGDPAPAIFRHRNFFGLLRVRDSGNLRQLIHGTTIHGVQSLDPARRREPTGYYSVDGPIGQVLTEYQRSGAAPRVAVIGLGTGGLACYAQPGQRWSFYEIDPLVERAARTYFTFLEDCPATVEVVLGDGRFRLREAEPHAFGLIILDAFSSDSIPLHLVSREALALYRSKLAAGGILAWHVSNHYLDMKPVVADLATEAGLVCCYRDDLNISPEDEARGKQGSQFVVMAASADDLGGLTRDPSWQPLRGRPGVRVWTDDFSNLFSVFKWR